MNVKHFSDGTVTVQDAQGRNVAEYHVRQEPGGTVVRRRVGHGESVPVQMPQPRYALAVESGLSLAGTPGRDAFDRDLLATLEDDGCQQVTVSFRQQEPQDQGNRMIVTCAGFRGI